MQWIILDHADPAGRRLEAVHLPDGERRVLIAHAQDSGYDAAIDPTGRVVAATVADAGPTGRETTRCALVDLERAAVRWLTASLDPDWHLRGLRFADTGRRIVTEGTYKAAAAADIYVFEFDPAHPLEAEAQSLLAGAANPEPMALRQPVFAPGGSQVFYLRAMVGGEYAIVVLDVDVAGASAERLAIPAPSRRELVITEPMRIAPDAGLAFCPQRKLLYFASVAGGKQKLARKPLTGQAPRTFWRAHPTIDAIAVDPEGEGAAYVAEGQLWWADVESDDVIALGEVGPVEAQCLNIAPGGWILFVTHEGDQATLRALHRPSRSKQVLWSGTGHVYGVCPVPEAAEARLDALPGGPLAEYEPTGSPADVPAIEVAAPPPPEPKPAPVVPRAPSRPAPETEPPIPAPIRARIAALEGEVRTADEARRAAEKRAKVAEAARRAADQRAREAEGAASRVEALNRRQADALADARRVAAQAEEQLTVEQSRRVAEAQAAERARAGERRAEAELRARDEALDAAEARIEAELDEIQTRTAQAREARALAEAEHDARLAVEGAAETRIAEQSQAVGRARALTARVGATSAALVALVAHAALALTADVGAWLPAGVWAVAAALAAWPHRRGPIAGGVVGLGAAAFWIHLAVGAAPPATAALAGALSAAAAIIALVVGARYGSD